jgi:predicted nucleic acid-binding protein
MVLVDTSVWVAHLRHGSVGLRKVLEEGLVLCHPFIVGELACGNLQKQRGDILTYLQALPQATSAGHEEVLQFIECYRLMGKGLGYIDIHLLASSLLTKVSFWTLDQKLHELSVRLGVAP